MAELVDWLHHESVTRADTNTASSYIRQDHHLPHGSLEPHITNADRIRAMSDEELAHAILYDFESETDERIPWCNFTNCNKMLMSDCEECIVTWLKNEVDDD